MSQTDSELVVAQNGRRGLGVTQVVENAALFEGDFGGSKETSVFGLLDRGTDDGNAVGAARDTGVDEGGRVETAQIVEGCPLWDETSMRRRRRASRAYQRACKSCIHLGVRWRERWPNTLRVRVVYIGIPYVKTGSSRK